MNALQESILKDPAVAPREQHYAPHKEAVGIECAVVRAKIGSTIMQRLYWLLTTLCLPRLIQFFHKIKQEKLGTRTCNPRRGSQVCWRKCWSSQGSCERGSYGGSGGL
jgi:hypothetical protein